MPRHRQRNFRTLSNILGTNMVTEPRVRTEQMTRDEILAGVKRLEPWFHYIELGDGIATKTVSAIGEPLDHPRPTWQKVDVCLPRELTGKSVLDVGCNAGFYCLEMKRRGAARVFGIDSQRNLIRQALFVRSV